MKQKKYEKFERFGSKGSISSMKKVGDFQKAGAAFPYFLFLVFYSLFQCVFATLRALCEKKRF